MKPTQTEFVISYDKFTDALLCKIDGEVISANYVSELLTYVGKLFDHTPNLVYSDMEYMGVLERDLGITFRFGK